MIEMGDTLLAIKKASDMYKKYHGGIVWQDDVIYMDEKMADKLEALLKEMQPLTPGIEECLLYGFPVVVAKDATFNFLICKRWEA